MTRIILTALMLWGTLLLGILLWGPELWAQDSGVSARRRIYAELGLSHEQARSVYKLKQKKHQRIQHLRGALSQVQRRINDLLLNDGVEEEIQLWHKKKIIIEAKIKQEKFLSHMKMRRLLSKDQRQKYFQIKKKWAKRSSHKQTF